MQCDIGDLHPNPAQPRSRFSASELEELALSIRELGIIQPLLVRKNNFGYEIVAGERRLRAARLAGLQQVPVIVTDVPDAHMLEVALIENIQREDLNPLEEADAYHRLLTEYGLTQEEIARRVGKKRATVANMLRLRQLPAHIRAAIRDNRLSMGHARALLGARTPVHQNAVWQEVQAKGLSVRQTEALIRRLNGRPDTSRASVSQTEDRYLQSLAEDLSRDFGTKIQIRRLGKKGCVQIDFFSDDDLTQLIERLKGGRP